MGLTYLITDLVRIAIWNRLSHGLSPKICTGNIEISKGTFLQLEPEKSTKARVLILERSGRSLSALPTSTRLLNPDKGKSLVAAFDQLK